MIYFFQFYYCLFLDKNVVLKFIYEVSKSTQYYVVPRSSIIIWFWIFLKFFECSGTSPKIFHCRLERSLCNDPSENPLAYKLMSSITDGEDPSQDCIQSLSLLKPSVFHPLPQKVYTYAVTTTEVRFTKFSWLLKAVRDRWEEAQSSAWISCYSLLTGGKPCVKSRCTMSPCQITSHCTRTCALLLEYRSHGKQLVYHKQLVTNVRKVRCTLRNIRLGEYSVKILIMCPVVQWGNDGIQREGDFTQPGLISAW